MSFKRHSKSTFDSGFESGLSDILDEILGGGNYDPVLEEAIVSSNSAAFFPRFACLPVMISNEIISMISFSLNHFLLLLYNY